MAKPSTNGGNGRKSDGKFAKGNKGGPGNPFARRVARFRSVLLDAVTEDDLREIAIRLVSRAKHGHIPAAREILTRVLGKPSDPVDPDRLDQEEKRLSVELATAESDLSLAELAAMVSRAS